MTEASRPSLNIVTVLLRRLFRLDHGPHVVKPQAHRDMLEMMRLFAALFGALMLTACDESVSGPATPLNTEFTLAPGQSAGIRGASLSVRFNGVTGDSRCPADALCIQGGSADVRITATSDGAPREYVLRTGDMRPAQHEGMTIALVQLSPYPFSSRTIGPDDYRATLKVTR